ncbi:gpi ethanolamine phosphate transferase [Ophiostoma piceae UAMH 11346]|uniref:GPI ethanolamine phosphate transferase 2 n=1 Tax=Ophiostoma piceae (strain UAMH 11346) TaxID=1262450 RepID=S3CYK4_OPHP1|nr:gpi ethanolamine phosphate transferase [Ophiostoma piceae UAMH 11346]
MARETAGTPLVAVLLLVAANLLVPLAIGIFGKGFFPYKPLLPGLAQYEDHGFGPAAPAPFDRVIFMVVDALRSDFVYVANSGFKYTQGLIRSGSAVPFTAHATSPTVTMPRIKAITTGSIPSFLDVILNVDEGDKSSSLASQDTWLAQMKAKPDGKLVLYGDDTWLKLFPDTFDRADGTSSFFVSDFTEVDNNVTRHVAGELRNDDWSVMVLHYLGLDHIGHKGGPRSPNMVPKQREMDDIVREIYEALDAQPHLASTLLVVCGDHGMNDAGNHGASSAGETSPALVFVSPKLGSHSLADDDKDFRKAPLDERDDFQFYRTVEQSDLAPTLGALLGFPAPQNNLGAFIPDFLPLWPKKRDQVQILMHNGFQILRILTAAFGDELFATLSAPGSPMCTSPASDIEELACEWQTVVRTAPTPNAKPEAYDAWVATTVKWLRNAQQTMSGMASNYDTPKLGLGLGAAVSSLVLSLAAALYAFKGASSWSAAAAAPFALISITYGIMMFASSYVEEEHHFWYWATSGWIAFVGIRSVSSTPKKGVSALVAVVAAFAAVRLLRGWNQTGQKFAGAPDLAKTFLQPNPALLWALVIAVYVVIGYQIIRGFVANGGQYLHIGFTIPTVALFVWSAFSFKLVFTYQESPELVGSFARPLVDGILELTKIGARGGEGATLVSRARVVFSGLGLATTAAVYLIVVNPKPAPKKTKTTKTGKTATADSTTAPTTPPSKIQILLPIYTLLAVTQSRTTNIPIFLLFGIVYRFLAGTVAQLSPADLTTAMLLLEYASFFAFGGTNAVSSVDLSSAYNGISVFSAGSVGVLTFLSNWAGSIYWAVASSILLHKQLQLQQQRGEARRIWLQHASLLTVFAAASAVAVMAACTALRTHLFVWTVFSPKYLYCVAWNLGMHLAVNLGLGSLLYWLGTF